MKKLKLLFASLCIALLANSQAGQINQINIVNFNVKSVLPGTIDSWLSTPAAMLMTAQKVPGAQLREPMLVVQIRSGSSIMCGNTMATGKRVDPFDVRVFNTADLIGILSNCRELKAGTYSICVQFFNNDKVAISREVCKDFRVEDSNVEYAPPTLITPDDQRKFTLNELMQPVQFRWTPLVPKPKEPVTYRLRVWQLMQGQNGVAAMRSNTPVIEKDVKEITQTTVTGILTGPCKPPYLCDFIWNVQALNREGKPMGNNNGASEPYTFSAVDEKTEAIRNLSPEDNKKFNPGEVTQTVKFRWTPLVPKPREPVTYRLRVWQLMQGQNGTQAMRTNQPVATKDITDLTEATVSGIYTGPCKPPYLCDFIWNVQVVTNDGTTGATSEPTSFGVSNEQGKCPENLFPEDKKKFTLSQAKEAITFKWSSPTTPGAPAAYKLRVWQLMQGQNATQAMRSNTPVITKEIRNASEATVTGILTGPCKPPYLCDFIWAVDIIDAAGQTTCTGEPSTFNVTEENNKCTANTFPEDKKKFTLQEAKEAITFRWTKMETPGAATTYRLRVWQLMQGQNGTQAMKSNTPVVTKEIRNANETAVSGILTGPCKPPYLCDFIWAVEMIDAAGRVACTSEPSAFNVTESGGNCPANVFPEDKKKINLDEAKSAITFRWTKPTTGEAGTYRLRVWQLMQGQNGTQAMRSNSPIVTKEVKNASEVTVNGILTGPCKPPYLCDFVWTVEKMAQAGQTGCTSEPSAFSITSGGCTGTLKITKDSCVGVENGMYKHRVCATYTADPSNTCNILFNNLQNNTTNNFGMFQSAQSAIFCSRTPGTTTSNFTAPLASQPSSLAPGASTSFCFDLYVPLAATGVKFTAFGFCDDQTGNYNTANANDTINVVPCICKECDKIKIEFPVNPTISESNNIVTLTGSIAASPKKVKRITADLVYFDMKADENCWVCNKNSITFGNFTGGTIQGSDFTSSMPGPHSVQWTNIGDANISGGRNFSLNIAIPPIVTCCDADINFCIRYIIMFEDCTVCNVKVCYSFKKDGCQK